MSTAHGLRPADRSRLLAKFNAGHRLRVAGAQDLSPRLRRIAFGLEGDFTHRPGQSLVLVLPDRAGTEYARHYTVASHAGDILVIDFVLHGAGPGADWARRARPGDAIEAFGPRGRLVPKPDADFVLMLCDETGWPAVRAILDATPEARGLALVRADPADTPPGRPPAAVEVRRLPAGAGVEDVLAQLPARPDVATAAVGLAAETGLIRAARHRLLSLGYAAHEIAGEGYWRAGRFGGHDHLEP